MRVEPVRRLLYALLLLAYVLHNDLWLWDDARIVLGLPVGLLYHVLFCLAVSGLFWALVRYGGDRDPLEPGASGDAGR